MAIYDCFQFFNENHIAEIRFNILHEQVDFFVIAESTVNHQGKPKKLNFDIKKFKKFEKKIIYIVVDDTPKDIMRYHVGGESLVEQHQRNSIIRGLAKASDDDLVILSDVDEIPNLKKLKYFDKNKFAVFSQKMFMYKLNLQNVAESNWIGSKITKRKNIDTMQKLRNMKFKDYPFWRLDKINQQIIQGGWHFSFLQTPKDILKKIESFSHGEFHSTSRDLSEIEKKIYENKDIFDRGFSLNKVEIDDSYPKYIFDNKKNLSEWIL